MRRGSYRGLVTCVLALALGTIGLVACGDEDSGPSTFSEEGFPFTFEYPGEFELTDDVTFDQSLGGSSDEDVSVNLDEDNGIVLQRVTLNQEVDRSNLDLAKRELDGLLTQVDGEGPQAQTGETAGFPSLEYDSIALTTPEDGESRIFFLFDGDQEYVINCQSTPDEREAVDAACEQMLDTIEPSSA